MNIQMVRVNNKGVQLKQSEKRKILQIQYKQYKTPM